MLIFLYIALLISAVHSYTPAPRWGQATSLISSYLFIQGGKQSLDNSQSYTGASASEDLLLLPLSNSFSVDSPPWDLISDSTNSSNSQGPAVAWHTLSAFNSSMLLVFGGVPNSVVPLPTQSDSGWLLLVYNRLIPQFTQEPSGWDNEPMRRIHHAAVSSTAGDVYIFGGERADDSQLFFSDHYVFSPDVSSFTALPTDNGPPGLTGHAAVILPNGQILVFGGLALSGLLSFNLFWTFDISSNSWSSQTIPSASIPQGRRGFAYVLLDDNTVLIHGGCSGDCQQTYSDGWIYNIAAATWTSVPALDAVGQRKDHFAVTYGGQVIFGFGYGQNGPANSSLVIFDPNTGAFPTTFVPPSPTSSVTQTIPVASATDSATASTHQVSGTVSAVHPTGTNSVGGGGGGGGGKPEGVTKKTTSIALGVVLGFLALVAAGIGAVWYLRRQQRHRWERGGVGGVFSPLGRGDSHGSLPSAARMVDAAPTVSGAVESVGATLSSWATWAAAAVGLGGVMGARSVAVERDRKQRRDMLADEDTHDIRYGWYDASDARSSRFGRLRRQGSGGSTWSLMSVFRPKPRREASGASFGSRAGSLLGHSDAPSEKDPFRDDVEAVVRPGPSRRQSSYASVTSAANSYIDPFADPISERDIAGPGALLVGNYAHGVPLSPVTEASGASASQSGSSAETHTPVLSPFESTSRASTFGLSSSSHALPIGASSPAGSSTRPRASSILDMQPREPEQPMRRSDTWWARFANKSLLDRRSSRGGGAPAPQRTMDFRDPNPLPQRLGFVKEETPSVLAEHRSSSGTERRGSGSPPGHGVARVAAHGKSMSSIQTQQTADSEALERMGDVDVVLRGNRHGGSTSTRGSEVTGGGSTDEGHGQVQRSWRSQESADEPVYTSPVEMVPASSFNLPTPPSRTRSLSPSVRPPLSTASSGSSVAERIRAYERRMSQDVGAPPPPPPSTNADVQERVRKKSHVHGVNYGLVPRASLFVANPGGRDASGDTA
ncbi:hypothetical protein GGX14DRAFT_629826 [Mycena pura]|uniref:Galactose oxidase n=1 Tax=Mycena pura TaxID=153505 RepID=A0AAD6YSP6_9AGAR|nr:hypothetical protein GGX14DRAFT_629826 [Mycena pura]